MAALIHRRPLGWRGAALLMVTTGCAEELPDALTLDPQPAAFTCTKKGQTVSVTVRAHRGKVPYQRPIPVAFTSSDPAVATVEPNGTITCWSSGHATVTASAWSLSSTASVDVSIVGSIAVQNEVPKKFRLSSPPHAIKIAVLDDKGAPIAAPKVLFQASDYCVDVDRAGVVRPLAIGECDVRVAAGSVTQAVHFNVVE